MAVIAVTDHVFSGLEVERSLFRAAGHDLRFDTHARTPDDVIRAVAGADAVLNCFAPMPAAVIQTLDRCQVIARYGVGLDTVDLDEATSRGILVTNVPDYCVDEVSDHTLALVLSLARGVARLDRSVRLGTWAPTEARPLHRLRGRTFGLIGFGRMARAVARKAEAFGYRIVATDPFLSAEAIRAGGAEPLSMEQVLARSDVVSLHVPLTDETRHLIGADQLALMRPGGIVVNTSRGPLIDLEALEAALASGHLAGAALDVLETEPPPRDSTLVQRPDVVVTPHAAFYSEESTAELQQKAAEQVLAVLAGETPTYAVNAKAIARRKA